MKSKKTSEDSIQELSMLLDKIAKATKDDIPALIARFSTKVNEYKKHGADFVNTLDCLISLMLFEFPSNKLLMLVQKEMINSRPGHLIAIPDPSYRDAYKVYGKITHEDCICRRLPLEYKNIYTNGIYTFRVVVPKEQVEKWRVIGFANAEDMPYRRRIADEDTKYSKTTVTRDMPNAGFLIAKSIQEYACFCLDKRINPDAIVTFDQLELFPET